MISKEDIENSCKDFAATYGEITLLKANIAAINKMFIKRGKDQELYEEIKNTMEKFKKKMESAE